MRKGYVIRPARLDDLDEISSLERLCFPEEEAASKAAFFERLSIYANHFWLPEKDGHIVSMVNGMVTDDKDLCDEMYYFICHFQYLLIFLIVLSFLYHKWSPFYTTPESCVVFYRQM